MYIGLAIYTRSPAAFQALSSFKILQLPSISTLKSYTRSNNEKPGECATRLQQERMLYDARIEEHLKAGKRNPPLGEGILIADEVKVASKLHWNSRDDSIVGHSMTAHEMATLQDLYCTLNDPQATKDDYILQTLWRDTSSNHDIIVGPYYSSTGPFKAKQLIACIMDALQHFHSFGFEVSMLVIDGASAKPVNGTFC